MLNGILTFMAGLIVVGAANQLTNDGEWLTYSMIGVTITYLGAILIFVQEEKQ